MRKKIGSNIFIFVFSVLLLSAALLTAGMSAQANPSEAGLQIICENKPAEKVIVEQGRNKKTLTATGLSENAEYQWQIRKKNTTDVWVDIYGKEEQSCVVSYALISSMVDSGGRAQLRCTAEDGGTAYTSAPVELEVSWDVTMGTANAFTGVSASTPMAGQNASLARGFALARATEYVSIQIDYEYQDGTKAFEPYIANLQAGTGFHAEVPSPSIVGYEPFFKETNEDAAKVTLNYAEGALTEDVLIKVIYKPAQVDYRVRYYLQNVSDDLYTEDAANSATYQGETGSYPPDDVVKMDIDGFSPLYYEPETIAADGSTEFRCYYDRKYYLMHYELDGGYGVEPIYARFGTPFVVNNPVRPGYVFGGWDLVEVEKDGVTTNVADGIADTMPGTIPSENRTYRAIWYTVETTYTVVYWKENADDNGYSYWGYEKLRAMSATKVSGAAFDESANHEGDVGLVESEHDYFTYNGQKSDKGIIIEGDGSTVVNVYYTRNYYTLYFRGIGKCVLEENHEHTDACYEYICHTHTSECEKTLNCTIPEHEAHTEECLGCGKTEHVHSEACCSLGLGEHTHTKDCYANVGNVITNTQNFPNTTQDGYIYARTWGNTSYYIYIKGSWYSYNSSATTGTIISPACGKTEHTHGDGCTCTLNLEEHSHVETCYTDEIHAHTDNCYTWHCNYGEHIHGDACNKVLDCGIPEHVAHTDECFVCTKTLHEHSESCCTKTGGNRLIPISDRIIRK